MSLNYTTYTSQLANLTVISSADPNFATFLPGCIDYAEQRAYRDLNLLNVTVQDTSITLASSTRFVALPQSITGSTQGFQTIIAVSVIDANNIRYPLSRSWQKVVDFLYPTATSSSSLAMPTIFAIIGSTAPASPGAQTLLYGPPPGKSFTLELTGTIRPTPLSSTNTTTLLSVMYPELFIAASMVFAAGYMRDFGAQADTAAMSAAWETQYKVLLQSAIMEQERLRLGHQVNKPPPPVAGQG